MPIPQPKPNPKISKVHRIKVKPVVPIATGVTAIGYAAPLPGSREYAPYLIVYARLVTKLQSKFKMGQLQPIFYPPLDDTSTILLQTEIQPDDVLDTILQGLDQNLQDALETKLTLKDKQQTLNILGTLLNTVEMPDAMWVQNLYGLAFSVGRRHQLKIDGKNLRKEIEAVTNMDMQHLAKTIFSPEKRATVVIEIDE